MMTTRRDILAGLAATSALDVLPQRAQAALLAGRACDAGDLQAGLNKAGVLHLPAGLYMLETPLEIPSGGGLVGDGYRAVLKAAPGFGDRPLVRNAGYRAKSDAARDRGLVVAGVKLDGSKRENLTATEFAAALALHGVDGARLDVWAVDAKGDGVTITYAEGALGVGCRNVRGRVRTARCARQGVAVICAEDLDLTVTDQGSSRFALDLETDDAANVIRRGRFRVTSTGTGNGTDSSGGVGVDGAGGSSPGRISDIALDVQVRASRGAGVVWRDAERLTVRGLVDGAAKNGLWGVDAGSRPSTVTLDVDVRGAGGNGWRANEVAGAVYSGRVHVQRAGNVGVEIAHARGGDLDIAAVDGSQQGVVLHDCQGVTFRSIVARANKGNGLWLRGGSRDNRVDALVSTGSVFGAGVQEDPGSNGNHIRRARLGANRLGDVRLSGPASRVERAP
jgi:hypothetical protein